MRSSKIRAVVIVLATIIPTPGAGAGEEDPSIPAGLVLERFSVARGGSLLIVPIRLGGKEHPFVVDTGASRTTFDISLPLGEPRGQVEFETGGEYVIHRTFDSPDARLGELPLRLPAPVPAMDLARFRKGSAQPFEGLLGMDVLRRHVVHVDFDRGELLILKSVPPGAGESVPIVWAPDDQPEVVANVAAEEQLRFLIDTGSSLPHSASVSAPFLRRLVGRGAFREVGSARALTPSGQTRRRLCQGDYLQLGEFRIDGPVVDELPQRLVNLLGLRFWSRFVVTFDFPGDRVYLRSGENFRREDRR
jgi:hypothetical protein